MRCRCTVQDAAATFRFAAGPLFDVPSPTLSHMKATPVLPALSRWIRGILRVFHCVLICPRFFKHTGPCHILQLGYCNGYMDIDEEGRAPAPTAAGVLVSRLGLRRWRNGSSIIPARQAAGTVQHPGRHTRLTGIPWSEALIYSCGGNNTHSHINRLLIRQILHLATPRKHYAEHTPGWWISPSTSSETGPSWACSKTPSSTPFAGSVGISL